MIRRLYQAITGQPWTTTRSATTEFGPPPGAVYAEQLSGYTDTELIRNGDLILARIRHHQQRIEIEQHYRHHATTNPEAVVS